MATHRISILGFATMPDSSGNAWAEPASLTQTNDFYPGIVLRFKDTATKVSVGGRFEVPNNYVGTASVEVIWTTTATSGNAIWDFDYRAIATGESLDPTTHQESVTVTTAAPGTSQNLVRSSMSLTSSNLVAQDQVQFIASRDGASSDTIAADLIVYDIIFVYSDT
jgi:hypothetical protein